MRVDYDVGRLVVALMALAALALWATSAQARPAPDSFADLADRLLPSVVNISTTQVLEGRPLPEMPQLPPGSPFEEFFKEFFDRGPQGQRQRQATSLGSGFIIDDQGHVVTNNHVIQDSTQVTVILHDNTRLDAKVVGRDPKSDIAVLKVESPVRLKPVGFGDSDKARVGDWVLAIGNPFGLGGTVTAGIVSARGRDINSGPYDDYIQTDASINRGNSGGPMFNMDGEVVGINTAIYSPSGGSVGIGFAIPSTAARMVVEQLIQHGQVKRGWLGVHIQTVTEEIAESLGLKEAKGALVANITPDGPAARAKIQPGDVIIEFAGSEVSEMRRVPRMVAETPVGKEVDVVVWRGGKKVKLKVTLGELDDGEAMEAARSPSAPPQAERSEDIALIGLSISPINDALRSRFELPDDARGLVVVDVAADGPAAEKGIRPGDVIVEVTQQAVATPEDVRKRVEEARKSGRKSVLLLIQGQGGMRFVAVGIASGKD